MSSTSRSLGATHAARGQKRAIRSLHQLAYPFHLTRAAALGADGDAELLGVLFTNLRIGSGPVTRAIEAPGLHRNQVVARQGFVQAALVGRFTGKAERIVMHAISGDTPRGSTP